MSLQENLNELSTAGHQGAQGVIEDGHKVLDTTSVGWSAVTGAVVAGMAPVSAAALAGARFGANYEPGHGDIGGGAITILSGFAAGVVSLPITAPLGAVLAPIGGVAGALHGIVTKIKHRHSDQECLDAFKELYNTIYAMIGNFDIEEQDVYNAVSVDPEVDETLDAFLAFFDSKIHPTYLRVTGSFDVGIFLPEIQNPKMKELMTKFARYSHFDICGLNTDRMNKACASLTGKARASVTERVIVVLTMYYFASESHPSHDTGRRLVEEIFH